MLPANGWRLEFRESASGPTLRIAVETRDNDDVRGVVRGWVRDVLQVHLLHVFWRQKPCVPQRLSDYLRVTPFARPQPVRSPRGNTHTSRRRHSGYLEATLFATYLHW